MEVVTLGIESARAESVEVQISLNSGARDRLLTKGIHIGTSPDLHDAARANASALGYPSFSAYITALLRLAAIHPDRMDDDLAQKIAATSPRKRDQIDRRILLDSEEALTRWVAVEEAQDAELEAAIATRFAPPPPPPPQPETAFRAPETTPEVLTPAPRRARSGMRC